MSRTRGAGSSGSSRAWAKYGSYEETDVPETTRLLADSVRIARETENIGKNLVNCLIWPRKLKKVAVYVFICRGCDLVRAGATRRPTAHIT